LRREDACGEGWLTRRVHPASPCPIYAAISGTTGLPGILLDVQASSVPPLAEYPASRGFEVVPVTRTPGRHGQLWLVLSLTDPTYRNIFETLAADVATAVAGADDEVRGLRAFLARLRTWQEFMRRYGPDGLTLQEQTGLFAELLFLGSVLLPRLSAADAVQAWTGPLDALHDFLAGGVSIEVKATTASPASLFHVSHLAQLDETRVSRLFVCHYALDAGGTSGMSLPDLVEELRTRLAAEDHSACDQFDRCLAAAGYLDAQARLYEDRGLRVARRRCFQVAHGFPRLRAADVPSGIAECSYAVELAACVPFELDDSRFPQEIFDAPP
jgi:hypothetical protein